MFPTSAAGRRTCTTVTPEMFPVGGGVVEMRVDRNPDGPRSAKECPGGQYFNSQIGTGLKTFTYGVFAARIKFQQQRGMHSAFLLFPYGPAPTELPRWDGELRRGLPGSIVSDRQSDQAGGGVAGPPHSASRSAQSELLDPHRYTVTPQRGYLDLLRRCVDASGAAPGGCRRGCCTTLRRCSSSTTVRPRPRPLPTGQSLGSSSRRWRRSPPCSTRRSSPTSRPRRSGPSGAT